MTREKSYRLPKMTVVKKNRLTEMTRVEKFCLFQKLSNSQTIQGDLPR